MSRSVFARRALLTLAITAIVSAICAVFYVPAFMDGLQDGPERVPVERLVEGYRPKTSYVVLVGRTLPVFVEELPGPDSVTRNYYVPLVPLEGGAVPVVLHDHAPPNLDNLAEQTEFEGILQGAALYDGLTDETRGELAALPGVQLTDEVDVLDMEWTPPMRLDMAWGILFASIVVGLIIGLSVALSMVSKNPKTQS